jgi:GTPase SAR1 family protein
MISETFERFRSEVAALLEDLHRLITAINNPELEGVINDIRTHVTEPFLFVVVGEIKSGKSSFVNALLQADICRVDPAPCTDVIQQIVYAPEKTETEINPYLHRVGLPVDILKQIAIVDTPGTNTIIRYHHEITERFIPNSGLVLFVFPAKNPHTYSAWKFLDFIKEEWQKRLVFILQQADLTTEEELRVNTRKVEEYAAEHGIEAPKIFITSAKWEQEHNPRSGFEEIRVFIRETVTGGRHFYLKLSSVLDSAEQVLRKVYEALKLLLKELELDKLLTGKIEQRLVAGKDNTQKDIHYLVDRLLEQYDRTVEQVKADFEDGFSILTLFKRALRSTFTRNKPIKAWLDGLQTQFEEALITSFEDIAREGAIHFTATLRDLNDSIAEELGNAENYRSNIEGRVIDFGHKREEVITDIRNKVKEMAQTDFKTETLAANPAHMSSQLISGSALTLVGALLLMTHVTLLDITGGILTGLGILIAGGVLVVKKNKIMSEFNRTLAEARKRLKEELTAKLTAKFDLVHANIRRSVEPFFNYVSDREQKIGPLMAQGEDIQKRILDLTKRISESVHT